MWMWMTVALALEPWQAEQVAAAEARLAAQPGGELLAKAIAAHGGMGPWVEAGTLAFDFDYQPIGQPEKRRYSRSVADLSGRRVVQTELGEGADASLGWNGKEAWVVPTPEAFPSDPRFWVTTPLYFVGLPWVLADPGTVVHTLDSVRIPETGVDTPLPTVKITYEAGTGDAPDDFYILHLHPESHQVLAVRYIVTYPAFFPDGGHSPEKILLWSGHTEVDGMVFATHYDSHAWDGAVREKKVDVDVAKIETAVPISEDSFDPPAHPVKGIDHLGLAVSDLAASKAFFLEVLGFRVRGQDDEYPAWFLTNGETTVTLWQAAPDAQPFDRKQNIGLHHLALSVESFEALDRLHGRIEGWPEARVEFAPELAYGGPAKHMMLYEPSGNRIELVHRPAGQ